MAKKLILVAAPPACGKTYVSEQIAKAFDHMVYLDKDDLSELLAASFAVSGQAPDMDGAFYTKYLRPAEYAAILNIAFSALRFEDRVILNAPFGKEVRDAAYMKRLRDAANQRGAELQLIWVTAPLSLCYERMKKRSSDRDILKLKNWDDYVKKTDYTPPYELADTGAVDSFLIFDTKDDDTFRSSLEKALKMIAGD